jgi:hypothetical protein
MSSTPEADAMLYLIVHQPPASAAFGEALQGKYPAHAVQVSTWILEVPVSSAHDLLAELQRITPLDQNASLLVTEVCGKPAGWQAFMSDQVMEHFYRRHYPTDSLG